MRGRDERHTADVGSGRPTSSVAVVLTIVALLAPVYLQRLGTADIVGDDEAREVGLIQDIAERGRWILPRFNDATFPDKPLLYHWLAAATCGVGNGCDERLVRLPSAISALALVATVGVVACRLFDASAGVAATLLLGLSPFLFEHARVARPDVIVTLVLAAALFSFYGWWREGCRSRRRAAMVGALLGAAVLAKGPVAPAAGTVTILAFLALRKDLGRARELLALHVTLPFLVVGGTWYGAALLGWGGSFARDHFIGRYLGNVLGGEVALGVQPSQSLRDLLTFYPLHLLLATLPWTPLLVVALISIWRDPLRRADPRFQFLQVWVAAVVLVFSLAAFKLRHYLLPALPAAALLAAPFTATLARRVGDTNRPAAAMGAAGALGLSAVSVALAAATAAAWWSSGGTAALSRSDRELASAVEAMARAHPVPSVAAAALGALALTVAMYAGLRRRWAQLLGTGAAATVAWMLVLQPAMESALAARASLKPFAEALERQVPEDAPLYFFTRVLRPLVAYRGRPIPSLRGRLATDALERRYVIVTEADLPRLMQTGREARILEDHVGRVGNLARDRVFLVEIGG